MSTVPFKVIPSGLRLPGAYFELDNSQANTSTGGTQRALIIGQITAAGIAAPNVPIISAGVGDAALQGGANSMLAAMLTTYRLNDSFGEVWYLPLADDPAATAAAGSIAFTAAPTAAGTIALYIAGQVVNVPVAAAETVAAIATAVAAAINAVPTMPVTATANAGIVALTAVNKGLCGNEIDIRFNYYGTPNGEATPTGLQSTITAMTGGATNPSTALIAALGNLGSMPFDFILSPYTDAASMNAVQQLLNDQTGRWSWQSQLYGHAFMAYSGTFGSLTTLGGTVNDQHKTILGFSGSPTPSWLWAAALCAQTAVSVRADPGVPLQEMPLNGVLAPPLASQFLPNMRETLLYDGISTFTVQQDGTVETENIITTYQKNAQDVADDSYLELETMFQLMLEIRTLQAMLSSKYSRCKLADNGTRPAAGSNLVTPNILARDIIALYQERADLGFVQNADTFATQLVVNKNTVNPDRVDILWPGTPVNQMRTFATLVQFRLQ